MIPCSLANKRIIAKARFDGRDAGKVLWPEIAA
jgi:hypothetical protein